MHVFVAWIGILNGIFQLVVKHVHVRGIKQLNKTRQVQLAMINLNIQNAVPLG